jgi:Ca2+-transporting ATPase
MEEMSDGELTEILSSSESVIFSRVAPEDKLRIVKLLESQDEEVAVTGDGANDAPALKRAAIGVATGQPGTDVAKEVSELVLLVDSFLTLVEAFREGRTIYRNLGKCVSSAALPGDKRTATQDLEFVLMDWSRSLSGRYHPA